LLLVFLRFRLYLLYASEGYTYIDKNYMHFWHNFIVHICSLMMWKYRVAQKNWGTMHMHSWHTVWHAQNAWINFGTLQRRFFLNTC